MSLRVLVVDNCPDFRPDGVLLDIDLPGGMDGCEVARRLRADEAQRDTLLVAITGFGRAEDVARGRSGRPGASRR